MGKPQSSMFGLRVRRMTIRTGTKKIRSSVNAFGRFIGAQQRDAAPCGYKPPPRFTIDSAIAGVNVCTAAKGWEQAGTFELTAELWISVPAKYSVVTWAGKPVQMLRLRTPAKWACCKTVQSGTGV